MTSPVIHFAQVPEIFAKDPHVLAAAMSLIPTTQIKAPAAIHEVVEVPSLPEPHPEKPQGKEVN